LPEKKTYQLRLILFTTIIVTMIYVVVGCSEIMEDRPAELDGEDDDSAVIEEEVSDDRPEVDDPFEEDEEDDQEIEDEDPDRDRANDVEPPTDERSSDDPDHDQEVKVIADGDYLLALVTKDTTLKSDYVPSNLKLIPSYMNPSYDMQLREEALEHLKELWDEADRDGVSLSIRSAYRSYATQKRIFKDYASQHGEEAANRFSARPGQSEHQLGTTVDFGGTAVDFSDQFGQTKQSRWLADNAHKYGFALSYPEGKEHITGYIYEPWHYRYIGIDEAGEWKESGLTLKEYLENQPQEFE